VQSLCATVIGRSASDAVKERWLDRLARGEALLSIAVTEQSAGSDAMAIRMEAIRASDGYRLNGEKWSINLADTADAHLVFAHLKDEAGGGSHGITAFLVPAGTPGLGATRYDNLGSRLGGRGTVTFQNVAVPEDHRIGGEGQGFTEVMRGFDFTRALIALQCIGAATASLDETWAHTRSRHAFGGPIARFQGVTLPLAEAEAQMAAGRELAYHALQLRDLGRDHTLEAAMVKSITPRAAFNAIHSCILTFGHAACHMDSPHQQRMRDVMGLEVGEGTENIMKMIVARQKTDRIASFR
jgi:cyclohexanecarboxyl-CoA dehydrogenase